MSMQRTYSSTLSFLLSSSQTYQAPPPFWHPKKVDFTRHLVDTFFFLLHNLVPSWCQIPFLGLGLSISIDLLLPLHPHPQHELLFFMTPLRGCHNPSLLPSCGKCSFDARHFYCSLILRLLYVGTLHSIILWRR